MPGVRPNCYVPYIVMKNSIRRIIARLLLPLVFFVSVFTPGVATAGAIQTFRVGSSYFPVNAQGAFGVATDIALLAGRATPWVTGLSLGYQVGKLIVEGVDASGAVVPLNILPSGLAQRPADGQAWSGWIYSAGVWSPPATSATVSVWTSSTTGHSCFSYSEAELQACVAAWYPSPVTAFYYTNSPTNTVGLILVQNGSSFTFGKSSACSAGYTLSGGVCNLSNASLVSYPSDNAPTVIVKADGSGFIPDSRDFDIAGLPSVVPSPIQATGKVNGIDTRITVEPQTGGGLKIVTEQQVMNSDGSMSTFRQTVVVASNGQVVSTDSQNYPGGLSVQAPGVLALSPSTQSFPADYARQGEANTAAQLVKNELAGVGDVRTSEVSGQAFSNAEDLKVQYAQQAQDVTARSSGFGLPSLPSWVFPEVAPIACVPPAFTWNGHTVSYDICPHVPSIKAIMAWVLYMLTAALCFAMVMSFRATRLRGG